MTHTQPSRAYNDHNVYILGAGFAAEAGLPLIKDFTNRMRDAAPWLEAQASREREQEAISRVLEFRLRAAAAAHRVPLNVENIEELFSLASASGDEELAKAVPLAIAATLDYARQTANPMEEWRRFQIGVLKRPDWKAPSSWTQPLPYIQEELKKGARKGEWYSCPPYDFYVGLMAGYFNEGRPERRDTIITFNYDMLIERALTGLGRNFTYALGPDLEAYWKPAGHSLGMTRLVPVSLQLLKLHGSLNWGSSVANREMMKFFQWPMVEIAGKEDQESRSYGLVPAVDRLNADWPLSDDFVLIHQNYDALRQNNFIPLLAPPTWQKMLTGALSRVWNAAVGALSTATNVVILGYSVPATDQHFRYLLAAGLQDNISLRKVYFVNPALKDERARESIESRLFGPLGLFRPELREQGVVELIGYNGEDTREFFTGPHDIYAGEPYRVRIGRRLNAGSYTGDDAPFRFSDRPENSGAWW